MERTFLNQAHRRRYTIGLLALTTALTAQTGAQNVPGSANNAKNLARLNCGARITWTSGHGTQSLDVSGSGGPASNLILDDNTLSCELTKGDNTFLIALPNISDFDRFTFINERPDLAGTVQLFVSNYRLSPNDANWTQVGRQLAFGKERFVNISLTGMEGKYVKILFHADKAGTIAGVGLYGERTLAAFADQQHRAKAVAAKIAYATLEPSSQNNLNFNFANLYSRARVVWVSSGSKDLASRMIDDDPTTGFEFSPNDPHPTVIIELSGDERLRRVSAVYETERGQLDIYLLNELPDPGILDKLKPVATIADSSGAGKAAAEFEPHGARYVALRWTPAAHRRGRHRFEIVEVGAFSDATPTIFDLQGIPELASSAAVLSVPKEPPVLVPTSP